MSLTKLLRPTDIVSDRHQHLSSAQQAGLLTETGVSVSFLRGSFGDGCGIKLAALYTHYESGLCLKLELQTSSPIAQSLHSSEPIRFDLLLCY